MADPLPKATESDAATGEWSDRTPPSLAPGTLTNSGATLPPDAFDIPNPFGRYSVIRLLGRGGMGAVFLGHDSQLDRPVAIKIPTFRGSLSATHKERFFREARAIAALRHPHICPVFDVDEVQGLLYLTMAYIEGQPLSAILADRGPMSVEKSIDLVRKVALAMHVAHVHGTIHRDLKPANIMIDPAGEPVVMDFGLARRADSSDELTTANPELFHEAGLTQFGSVLGTPAYMPPEQARGDLEQVGARSDVYALGVILFELLSGRRPFSGTDTADLIRKIQVEPPPSLREFYPWMSETLDGVCQRAMAKRPDDRYWTMAAFADALKDVAEPELKVVVPPPLPKRFVEPPMAEPVKVRKSRKWIGCLAFLFLTSVICIGGPLIAVVYLVDQIKEWVQEKREEQDKREADWTAINNFWQAPPADASNDVLFPASVGQATRLRFDVPEADSEFGLTFPGRRAYYASAEGFEIQVRAYRRTEAEAKGDIQRISKFLKPLRGAKPPDPPNTKRLRAQEINEDSKLKTLTYMVTDANSANPESGLLWYGKDWLFVFRAGVQKLPLGEDIVGQFATKYLIAVGKMSAGGEAK